MLYIIIPVFNRKTFTKNCLEILGRQSFSSFKTIVVDDGSTDGTQEMVKTMFPGVKLLETGGDYWWTKTVNLGITYALSQGAAWAMTLNDDTLPAEDFVEKMMDWAKIKPTAVLGALEIDHESKEIVHGGEYLNEKTAVYHPISSKVPIKERKGLHPVTHLPGRGCLIPAAVFERIGLFDEKRFPHYLADFDFTHNARKAGFEVFCNYDAVIWTYPEESGAAVNRKRKTLKGYFNHLFSIKGGANLRDFTVFTLKNCTPKYIPQHLLLGYSRRLVGYWIK